jgi:DNA-binding response OmpR family regulator
MESCQKRRILIQMVVKVLGTKESQPYMTSNPTYGSILIIPADKNQSVVLNSILTKNGYVCRILEDPKHLLYELIVAEYEAVIVDFELPGIDTIKLIENINSHNPSLAVITTAKKEHIDFAALTLEHGGQDYLLRPFIEPDVIKKIESSIFIVKMRNSLPLLLRTCQGNIMIDQNARRVWLAEKELKLTNIEFKILQELARNAGKVLEYDDLFTSIGNGKYSGEKNHLRVYVNSIRKKTTLNHRKPSFITNVSGVGYRFDFVA